MTGFDLFNRPRARAMADLPSAPWPAQRGNPLQIPDQSFLDAETYFLLADLGALPGQRRLTRHTTTHLAPQQRHTALAPAPMQARAPNPGYGRPTQFAARPPNAARPRVIPEYRAAASPNEGGNRAEASVQMAAAPYEVLGPRVFPGNPGLLPGLRGQSTLNGWAPSIGIISNAEVDPATGRSVNESRGSVLGEQVWEITPLPNGGYTQKLLPIGHPFDMPDNYPPPNGDGIPDIYQRRNLEGFPTGPYLVPVPKELS